MEMFLLSINDLFLKTLTLMQIHTFTYGGSINWGEVLLLIHSEFMHFSKLSTFSVKEEIHFYFFRYILLKKETQQELFFLHNDQGFLLS